MGTTVWMNRATHNRQFQAIPVVHSVTSADEGISLVNLGRQHNERFSITAYMMNSTLLFRPLVRFKRSEGVFFSHCSRNFLAK